VTLTCSRTAHLQHAAEYDRGVLRVAHSLIGITRAHGDRYDGQLQQSLRMGGFGLTSAVTLAPAAYIAGAEVTMRLSPAFATVWSGAEPLAPSCRQYLALDDCILRVTGMEGVFWQQLAATDAATSGEVPAPVLPDSAHDFVRHFSTASPTVIQSAVVHRIQTLSFIASTKAAVDAGRAGLERLARMDALRQPGSADWLTVMPTEARLRLSDVHWRWAAQLRLGLQLPTLSDTCHGCNKTGLAPGDGWHLLSCSGGTGRITARHDEVVNILSRLARLIGAVSLTEPVDLDADSDKRPDLEIHLPKKTLLVDVSFVHPSAQSYLKAVAKRGVEAVGDQRDAVKHAKYDAIAARHDMKFAGFVMYTLGGWHKSAIGVMNAMRQAVEPVFCPLSPLDWAHQLKDHIAIAVQRGNADIMVTAAQRDRHYELHGRPHSRPVRARAVTYAAAASAPAGAAVESLSSPSDSWAGCEKDDDMPMTAVSATLAELSLMAADDVVVNAAAAAQDVHSVCAVNVAVPADVVTVRVDAARKLDLIGCDAVDAVSAADLAVPTDAVMLPAESDAGEQCMYWLCGCALLLCLCDVMMWPSAEFAAQRYRRDRRYEEWTAAQTADTREMRVAAAAPAVHT
jgi:hypothetical protein